MVNRGRQVLSKIAQAHSILYSTKFWSYTIACINGIISDAFRRWYVFLTSNGSDIKKLAFCRQWLQTNGKLIAMRSCLSLWIGGVHLVYHIKIDVYIIFIDTREPVIFTKRVENCMYILLSFWCYCLCTDTNCLNAHRSSTVLLPWYPENIDNNCIHGIIWSKRFFSLKVPHGRHFP